MRSKKTQTRLEKIVEALEEQNPKGSKAGNLVGGFLSLIIGGLVMKEFNKTINNKK